MGTLLKELTANNVNTRILIRKDISIFKGIPGKGWRCNRQGSLVKAFEGADIVYHLAGLIDIKGGNEEWSQINVEGTRNVVEACIQCGVKACLYVIGGFYIPLPGNEPMTEVNRFIPTSWRATTPKQRQRLQILCLTRGQERS